MRGFSQTYYARSVGVFNCRAPIVCDGSLFFRGRHFFVLSTEILKIEAGEQEERENTKSKVNDESETKIP